MPLIKIYEAGVAGLNRDVPPHELPPEVFTDAKNVLFENGEVVRAKGYTQIFDPPVVDPYWLLPVPGQTYRWIYAGLAKVYTIHANVHTNITRQSGGVDVNYTGGADNYWVGEVHSNVPVFTNGVDPPQMWRPPSHGTRLTNLANWPAGVTAKVIRPYKAFLVAVGVTESGTYFPDVLRWSHPADPNEVPVSWNFADPTKLAGRIALPGEGGQILDFMQLGDVGIIYRETATFGMQHIGGILVHRFYRILSDTGILAARCVQPAANGRLHFLATADDVILFDGQEPRSVLTRRMRRWLFNNIDTANYKRSFVVVDRENHAAMFCFPMTGTSVVNTALVWDWINDTLTLRELPNITFAAAGLVDPAVTSVWDSDGEVWDSDATLWDDEVVHSSVRDILMARAATPRRLFHLNRTQQANGADYEAYVERVGLALIGRDREGKPKVDTESRKHCSEVWVRATGSPFEVHVGASEVQGAPVAWRPPRTFNPATDRKVDVAVSGKFLAIRFRSTTPGEWRLQGYDMNISVGGRF